MRCRYLSLLLSSETTYTLTIRIMKKLLPSTLLLLLSVLFTQILNAQTTLNSNNGYSVTLSVRPVRVIVTGYWDGGYNYQVELSYNTRFTGSNAPSSMWNMPGVVGCGSQTNGFQLPTGQGSGSVYTYTSTAQGDYRNASVAKLGCTNVTMSIDGPGISYSNISIAQPVVLGVKMASFNATFNTNKVTLDWSTASEDNNDFFTIERSSNGAAWSSIGEVKGAVNSTAVNYYRFADVSPMTGTSYYRIRQTDLDGRSTVSETKTVSNNNIAKSISLYPVPNSGNNITVTGIREYNNHQLSVISANGNVVYNTTMTGSSVELPELKTGFYFIRITDRMNGEVTNIRYVKN